MEQLLYRRDVTSFNSDYEPPSRYWRRYGGRPIYLLVERGSTREKQADIIFLIDQRD